VDTTRINIIKTNISYSNVIPYVRTDGEENLFMYSSSLHIFYVLLQCNVDVMSLNHYLMYVAEPINYLYLLFQLIIFFHFEIIYINLWDNILFFHLKIFILI
jgi:hypothetical protein